MVRYVLSDPIWEQLQQTMKKKGCHRWKNDRLVMEAILWKLRTGAPWRDIPEIFCPWKTAYNRFNRWALKDLWADFFLIYEAKLMRSGYSSMEVTCALINMRPVQQKKRRSGTRTFPRRPEYKDSCRGRRFGFAGSIYANGRRSR